MSDTFDSRTGSTVTPLSSDDHRGNHSQAPLVAAGTVIGPYRLVVKVGEGAMGAVWRAVHARLDKTVALKLLPPQRLAHPEAIARFEREMQAAGRVVHPNVVQAFDAGEADGVYYLAMEFVEGTDLAALTRRKGPLSIAQACRAVRQASLGLSAAHARGLVHRDVKPHNLLLSKDGKVKVLDLGLARLTEEAAAEMQRTGLTAVGQVMGTPDYMAPEQWDDSRTVGPAADLYALGCTLYFLLTGHPPFADEQRSSMVRKMRAHLEEEAPDLAVDRPDAPPGLCELYRRLLAKKTEERPVSATEVADLLIPFTRPSVPASLIGNAGVVGVNVERQRRQHAKAARAARPWWLAATGVAVSLASIVGIAVWTAQRDWEVEQLAPPLSSSVGVDKAALTPSPAIRPVDELLPNPDLKTNTGGEIAVGETAVPPPSEEQPVPAHDNPPADSLLAEAAPSLARATPVQPAADPLLHRAIALAAVADDGEVTVSAAGGTVKTKSAAELPTENFTIKELTFPRATAADVDRIVTLGRLDAIWLPHPSQGTTWCFERLREMSEVRRVILNEPATAEELTALATVPGLRSVWIFDGKVEPTAFRGLAAAPNLTELKLQGPMTDDRHLSVIVESLHGLRNIHLLGTSVTPAGVRRLSALPNLTWIEFMGRDLTLGMAKAVATLPKLTAIIAHSSCPDPMAWDQLAAAQNLTTLFIVLADGEARAVELSGLARLSRLTQLTVMAGVPEDTDVDLLTGLRSLTELSFGAGHRFSPAGLARLQAALPTCRIRGSSLYASKPDGAKALFVADADGTNPKLFAQDQGFTSLGSPDCSPDGSKVACDGWRSDKGETHLDSQVLVFETDGSPVRVLGDGAMPSWSPNGKKIVFTRHAANHGVWVMNADGTGRELVDARGWSGRWSPDGATIAYTVSVQGGADLCLYDVRTGAKRLVFGAAGPAYKKVYWTFAWSPDSQRICFKADRPDGQSEVASVSVRGPLRHRVLYRGECGAHLAWHPNGSRILLVAPVADRGDKTICVLATKGLGDVEPLEGLPPEFNLNGQTWKSDGQGIVFCASKS